MRVAPEPLGWLESRAERQGVAVSVVAREVLSRGRACIEGRCSSDASKWQQRYEERGRRNVELLARIEELESRPAVAVWSPPPADVAPWDVPDSPAPAVEDDLSWLPLRLRDKSESAWRAAGYCPVDRRPLQECADQQLHDDGA
jgi:hypothetical protein